MARKSTSKAVQKARRTASSIKNAKCDNPKVNLIGKVVDFYNVRTGNKVARPIDQVKSYSLAKGRNVNRSKGMRSYMAFSYGPEGTLTRGIGICKSGRRSTRSGTRRKNPRKYIRKNKKRTKH